MHQFQFVTSNISKGNTKRRKSKQGTHLNSTTYIEINFTEQLIRSAKELEETCDAC